MDLERHSRGDSVLGAEDLRRFVELHALQAEIVRLEVETLTVEDAALAVSTGVERIVKSLLFLVDGQPVVAIACGTSPIDRRPIATRFGVGRKRVKLADAETVLQVTGYRVGALPPFGHRRPLPTLIDSRVLAQPEVFAGGGEHNALLRVSTADIQRLTSATELDLVDPQEPAGA